MATTSRMDCCSMSTEGRGVAAAAAAVAVNAAAVVVWVVVAEEEEEDEDEEMVADTADDVVGRRVCSEAVVAAVGQMKLDETFEEVPATNTMR